MRHFQPSIAVTHMIFPGFRRQLLSILFFCCFLLFASDLCAQRRAEPSLFSEGYLNQEPPSTPNDSPVLEVNLLPKTDESKSPFLAGVLSFILPGLGEAYAGRFDTGKYSLGIEVGLVTGLLGTTIYANSLESDYQVLARTHGGVSSGSKSEQFWKDISSYQSSEDYNQERMRERDTQHLYGPENSWSWDSDASRKQYRDIRISSDNAFRTTYYFIVAMGINRLFSIINAVRFVNEHNDLQEKQSFHIMPKIYMNTALVPDGMGVFIEKSF